MVSLSHRAPSPRVGGATRLDKGRVVGTSERVGPSLMVPNGEDLNFHPNIHQIRITLSTEPNMRLNDAIKKENIT